MPVGFLRPFTLWPVLVLALVAGLAVGSFLNVCIVRWPEGGSVVRPPSRCPRCGRGVRWYENVPVLGWLALRGRCAGCGERIGLLYPAVELSVGLIWLASVWLLGPTFDGLRVAVLVTTLLGIAVTDARAMVIPDGFTVFLLLWSFAGAVVSRTAVPLSLFAQPYESFLGACAGAGVIAILGWLAEVVLRAFGDDREAMGMGDVTMMAGVGAALGPERALLTVLFGAAIGAVASLVAVAVLRTARAGTTSEPAPAGEPEAGGTGLLGLPHVPFGVFLAPAAVVALFWGDRFIAWYFTHVLSAT